VLVELSMVEQRYDAVREVLEGATVKDTAIRYGIDRRTMHRWLVRYATDGLAALADKPSKPDRCLHQMAPDRGPFHPRVTRKTRVESRSARPQSIIRGNNQSLAWF
jgi:hypothetical protein